MQSSRGPSLCVLELMQLKRQFLAGEDWGIGFRKDDTTLVFRSEI